MACSITEWVYSEFADIDFGDPRLMKRLKCIMISLMKKSAATIASTFPSWAEIKATYRFLANNKVDEHLIMAAHRDKTIERAKEESKILLIQDTTYLDYKHRKKTEELDYLWRNKKTKAPIKGLMLHSTLAVSLKGVPVGLFDQRYIERKEFIGGTACPDSEKKKPTAEKESIRWLEVLHESHDLIQAPIEKIHILDREGDIYEFYRDADRLDEKYIVRVKSNRAINKIKRREAPSQWLFDNLENQPVAGYFDVDVQVNDENKFRKARLSVTFCKITISPPANRTVRKDGDHLDNIQMTSIMAIERKPPKGAEPIKWILMTNLVTNTLEEAIQYINWYSYRWNIEIFHKILKSGCYIEKAQLRHAKNLKKYIVLKSIIAWRLFWLTRIFEKMPDEPCDNIISQEECHILKLYYKDNDIKELPSVKKIYYWIAKLGGYIGRNTDPPPGIISIWRGWMRFMNLIEDYHAFCG